MKKIIKLIKQAKTIALFSHENPDPDTVGSTLALKLILEKLGKKVSIFCDHEKNDNYMFLNGYEQYNLSENMNYELFIAVDVADSAMLAKYEQMFLTHENTIRLDHHISGKNYAKNNLMMPYSACSILIYYLSKKLRVKIDSDIATRLYFGICGDTGIFRNNNTDSETFLVCSELLKYGAEPRRVYAEFFDKKTVPWIKLTSSALLNAKIDDKNKFVIMSVAKSDYENFGAKASENIGNLPHSYLNAGYKIAGILKERDDGIHCSLRSKYEYDCSKIAEKFDGGGHKNASGCKFDTDLATAEKQLASEIKKYLKTIGE